MTTTDLGALPSAGRICCDICHGRPVVFDETQTVSADGNWRLTASPLSWGNVRPEILVLGFSKGPNQAADLARLRHDEIPYRKGRLNVGKILAHVGLIDSGSPDQLRERVDHAIADTSGRFGWGSLIRCTVERASGGRWTGSGRMIDPFMASTFGQRVSTNCATRFLSHLPFETKLVVMFGLGTRQKYVSTTRRVFEAVRPGRWCTVNPVAYTDETITVVHVEHFASQGPLIPNWLGETRHPRAEFGRMAQEAIAAAVA